MTLSRLNRILEIFWWSVTGLTLIIVIIMISMEGANKWAVYLLVPVVAAFAALLRRFASKRLAKSEAFRAENDKNKK